MRLVGTHYSPFVRRVAISLEFLGVAFESHLNKLNSVRENADGRKQCSPV